MQRSAGRPVRRGVLARKASRKANAQRMRGQVSPRQALQVRARLSHRDLSQLRHLIRLAANMKIELPAYSRLHRHVRSEPPQAVQIPLGHYRNVEPNKADHGEALLKSAVVKSKYHKQNNPIAIAKQQDIARVAYNSRSFRRFLHVLSHVDHLTQSKHPIPL